MPTALDLAVRFGVTIPKIEAICAYLHVPLQESDIERNADFERIARSIKRGRYSAYTMAWIMRIANDEQADFLLGIDDALRAEFEALGRITDADMLKNAKSIFDRITNSLDTSDNWQKVADWIKLHLEFLDRPVKHSYLAVRFILSLPANYQAQSGKAIAQIFNKARHRGLIDGWHKTVEENGSNIVLYQKGITLSNDKPIVDIGLSANEIETFAERLGTREIGALASFIAYEKKLKLTDVMAYLQKTLAPLDL
jgi:hypothetical protein